MPKKFSSLSAPLKADPHQRERINERKRAIETALELGKIRESRSITQRAVASRMAVSQANISRIEHEEDLYISTLRSYIGALGGRLELRAVFEDSYIEIGPNALIEYAVPRPTSVGLAASMLPEAFRQGFWHKTQNVTTPTPTITGRYPNMNFSNHKDRAPVLDESKSLVAGIGWQQAHREVKRSPLSDSAYNLFVGENAIMQDVMNSPSIKVA